MAVIIATFQIGANGISSMSLWGVARAILIANLAIAIFGSLSGDIRVEHGLSFAAYLRALFGTARVHSCGEPWYYSIHLVWGTNIFGGNRNKLHG